MEKRKININRPKVSSEEISQHMDFGSVMGGHAALTTPWYKTTGFIASSVGTVVVAASAILYVVLNNDTPVEPQENPAIVEQTQDFTYEQQIADNNLAKPDFLNRPFEDIEKLRTNFTVVAEEGGDLNYHSGTEINVPEGAFLNSDGSEVNGEVQIQYVEYHDQGDIFLSGIPMTYDSAGNTYHFESAGMLEINAFQNGVKLDANPERPIQISMRSRQEGTRFNMYHFDEAGENWVYKGKDQVTPIDEDADLLASADNAIVTEAPVAIPDPTDGQQYEPRPLQELATPEERSKLDMLEGQMVKLKDEIEEIKNEEPQKPVKADRQRNRFNLDYNINEFPELEVYQNTMFELGDEEENKDFSTDLYQIEWEDMKLSEHNKGISYKLTLIKGSTEKSFVVYPVFEGDDHAAAMKQYKKKFSDYQSKLQVRLDDEAKAKEEYQNLRKKLQEEQTRLELEWQQEMEQKKAEWHAQQERMQAEYEAQVEMANRANRSRDRVLRVFDVMSFGIWNSDCPQQLPSGAMVSAHFADEKGNELALSQVYLVQKDMNAMFSYYNTEFSAFAFDPSAENVIWAVTTDNKLAIVKSGEFSKVIPNQKHTFTMTLIDQKFRTTEDVKKHLEI